MHIIIIKRIKFKKLVTVKHFVEIVSCLRTSFSCIVNPVIRDCQFDRRIASGKISESHLSNIGKLCTIETDDLNYKCNI